MRKIVFRRILIVCLLVPFSVCAESAPDGFSGWLLQLRQEAKGVGVSERVLDTALSAVRYLPRVIAADRNQPEFKKSLDAYLEDVINPQRVRSGRQKLAENDRLLQRIAKRYRVQPRFIVALWGIETYYGKHTGQISIIDALATLAFDGRRSTYFRRELINALKIIDAGHIDYHQMKGSWAGAMGQLQFMPSSFLHYAVDGNGDGRIDLWGSPADCFSSAANYLVKMGWQPNRIWGREVRVPASLDKSLIGMKNSALLTIWQKYGVRRSDGSDLPHAKVRASLIQPDAKSGRFFLVYDNYRALLKWNRAHSFALAVGMLADRLAAGK